MKHNYQDIIIQNVSVVIGSAITGLVIRFVMLEKGADQFTANSIFWIVILIGLVFYTSLVLLGVSLFELYKQLRNKNSSKNSNVDLIASENLENVTDYQKQLIDENTPIYLVENSEENILSQTTESVNLESIRKTQLQQKQQSEIAKRQIALDYTRNQFALYVTDDGLKALCNAVSLYSKKEEIPNDISVHTEELTNLDLYHFGWNIWNHFRPIKQEEISKLLKTVFVSLDDIDLDSIKSHLKDEPKKGIITIQENLADYQKT